MLNITLMPKFIPYNGLALLFCTDVNAIDLGGYSHNCVCNNVKESWE